MPKFAGIDLGTTNSLIATVIDGEPAILKDREGRGIVPSVLGPGPGGQIIAGHDAKAGGAQNPRETIYSVKRLMGRDIDDVDDLLERLPYRLMGNSGSQIRVKIGPQWLTPPQLSAQILTALKKQAEDALNAPVENVVITVPAYFNDGQRQATKDAGALAGLNVVRIVNEPTAACLAYGLQEKQEGVFAVYDLGGGTFDISILRVQNGVFEVLATNGDTELGGDDLDRKLAQQLLAEAGVSEVTPELIGAMRTAAEDAKIALTGSASAQVRCEVDGQVILDRELTREQMEEWIRPLIAKTLEPCRHALEDADLLSEDIDEVVMVGGSTRIPLVRKMVGEYFECEPHVELNPDEVVALGAAVQADILQGNRRDLLLLDVTPLSLGIETYGGAVSRLIPRNSTVPCSITEMFTTFVDNQTHVDVHVLQGEHEIATGNRSLARFKLGPLTPMPAGFARVEVTFSLDADGILSVSARDQRTGKEESVSVTPSYGLTEEELDAMLKSSADAAGSEKRQRQLIEERNYGEMTARAVEKAIEEAGDLIDEVDLIVVQEQLEQLHQAMKGEDYRAMRAARERLDGASQTLAAAQMNAAFARELKGKNASEVFGEKNVKNLTPQDVAPEHQQSIPVQIDLGKTKPEKDN